MKKTEHVPKELVSLFEEALDKLYPGIPFSVQEMNPKDNVTNQENATHKQNIYKYGITFGTSAIIIIFESLLSRSPEREETMLGSFCFLNNGQQTNKTNEIGAAESQQSLESSMLQSMLILDSVIEPPLSGSFSDIAQEYLSIFKKYVEQDKLRGYRGERKGNEVCLPSPNVW